MGFATRPDAQLVRPVPKAGVSNGHVVLNGLRVLQPAGWSFQDPLVGLHRVAYTALPLGIA